MQFFGTPEQAMNTVVILTIVSALFITILGKYMLSEKDEDKDKTRKEKWVSYLTSRRTFILFIIYVLVFGSIFYYIVFVWGADKPPERNLQREQQLQSEMRSQLLNYQWQEWQRQANDRNNYNQALTDWHTKQDKRNYRYTQF
jgi:magnesium-transporting ATPase (P-type)